MVKLILQTSLLFLISLYMKVLMYLDDAVSSYAYNMVSSAQADYHGLDGGSP